MSLLLNYSEVGKGKGKKKKKRSSRSSNTHIFGISDKVCKIIPKLIHYKLNHRHFWQLTAFAVLNKVRECPLHALGIREL